MFKFIAAIALVGASMSAQADETAFAVLPKGPSSYYLSDSVNSACPKGWKKAFYTMRGSPYQYGCWQRNTEMVSMWFKGMGNIYIPIEAFVATDSLPRAAFSR